MMYNQTSKNLSHFNFCLVWFGVFSFHVMSYHVVSFLFRRSVGTSPSLRPSLFPGLVSSCHRPPHSSLNSPTLPPTHLRHHRPIPPDTQPDPRPTILMLIPRTQHIAASNGQIPRLDRQPTPTPALLPVLRSRERVPPLHTPLDTKLRRHIRRIDEAISRKSAAPTRSGSGLGPTAIKGISAHFSRVRGRDVPGVGVDV
jgi:hypothetical protein